MRKKEETKFTKSVKNLIDANYNTYKHISRIEADFRTEKGTTKSYNGRQILEMLQNADDAKTDVVSIKLDRENNVLSISNNGMPFTVEEGIASLMVASTSSKKKEFIGNKGLGFRSILNWVSEVKIRTKEEVVIFSEKIAKEEFNKLPIDSQKELITNNQDRLRDNEVPFAILSIPRVYTNKRDSLFETTIELTYKEEVDGEKIIEKIEEQLGLLAPEILLFLNYTDSIQIIDSSNNLTKKIIRKYNEDLNKITINDSTWNIEDSGEVFYETVNDKDQYFNYKIAWQDNLSDTNSKLFTHFPTQEHTNLPFLIHATFDLDPSRNYLNPSKENENLLLKIANGIGEIAESRIRNKISDWNAYKFLSPERISDNTQLAKFHQELEKLKSTLEIYPCVDGSYCKLEDVLYYGDELSAWVIKNGLQKYFSNLLIPNNFTTKIYTNQVYTFGGWLEIMNLIKNEISNIHERALLIKILTSDSFSRIHNSKTKLPLLIGKKGISFSENTQVFTIKKEHIEAYKIEEYVDIAFMSSNLLEELLDVLKDEISDIWNGTEDKSRPLKKIISKIVNIGSNDITDVIRNIVSSADNEMENATSKERNDIAIGLVESLFSIYQENPLRRNTINQNIPLLNKNLDLVSARDLYLGYDYKSAKSTSIVFKDILIDKDYLVGNDFWQLEEGGYEYLENFFSWLGVNKITKINSKSEKLNRDQNDEYTDFVFNNVGFPENNSHKEYSVVEITDFKKICSNSNFSLEVLIAWLIVDSNLSSQLEINNLSNTFSYSYHNKVTPIYNNPSFIYYQIKELYLKNLDSKFIVDLDFAKELGYNSLDFEHQIFIELNIQKDRITPILNQLNISISFNDLEPEDVYEILNRLCKIDLEKKDVRKLYDLAFKFFKSKDALDFSNYKKDYKLLAKRKGKKEFIELDNVYYSDNATLPSKISEEFWVFDFPTRLGETQISKFFGIKTFKEIDIKIKLGSIKESNISDEFQEWFSKIKPFILTYRISSIKKSNLKTESDELKNVEISIVSSLIYTIKGGDEKQLLSGEVLPKENNKGYYLCVEENTTLDIIKDTPNICEAFAEILCMLFKVNEHKDDYRVVFKDKKSLLDTKYLIDIKSLNDYYNIALELLGISTDEINFWAKIYRSKKIYFSNLIKDSDELYELILKDLNFNISKKHKNIDYQNLDNEKGISFLNSLVDNLDIPLTEIFPKDSQGITSYHLRRFETILMDYENFFNSCLWEKLNKDNSNQKYLILYQEVYGNLHNSEKIRKRFYQKKFELKVDYLNILKDEVKGELDIEIDTRKKLQITIKQQYLKILKENNLEEVDLENAELRSLLYFNGNEGTIKEIAVLKNKTDEDSEESTTEKLTGQLIYSSTKKVVPKLSNSNGRSGSWNHSKKDINRNKKAGRKAEERVYNSLIESKEIEDVKWVSSFSNTSDKSDTKHYDIRYKPANSNNWKYLEVKSFNGSNFHLSKSEKEEGVRRGLDYEIALVMGEEIHILQDYFNEGIEFENNSLFYATPADYLITLKIE
jgi:hypothetical protein